jgi:uncharacterized protein YjbJ (UPF0337 family)
MGEVERNANRAEDLRGRAKESVGEFVGDRDLAREGRADQARAAVKEVGESLKEAAEDVGEKLKDAAHAVKHALREDPQNPR